MRDKFEVLFRWQTGHEFVALHMITHEPRRCIWNETVVYVPYTVYLGRFEEKDDGSYVGYFSKRYWGCLEGNPHFTDFAPVNDREFVCRGSLMDLMGAIQKNAEEVQASVKSLRFGWFRRKWLWLFCK